MYKNPLSMKVSIKLAVRLIDQIILDIPLVITIFSCLHVKFDSITKVRQMSNIRNNWRVEGLFS